MQQASELKSFFQAEQYAAVRKAVPKLLCDFGINYFNLLLKAGFMRNNDAQVEKSRVGYGIPFAETLLAQMTGVVGEVTGRQVLPTYSYTRVYFPGAEMKEHTDRESCEVSTTLTLGYNDQKPWPIYLTDLHGKEQELLLEQGDFLIFTGSKLPHWRNVWLTEPDHWQIQVFLHYVYADGPYKDNIYDGRPALCIPRKS